MRKRIKEKLNSNHGVSIIFALALFLICTMVSSLIIVAAASGSNRSSRRMEQQRAYFAISSASQMLVDDLKNQGVFVGENEAKRYGCKQYFTESKYKLQKTDDTYIEGYLIPASLIADASTPIITDSLHTTDDTEIKTVDNVNTTLDGLLGAVIKKAATNVYQYGTDYEENFKIALDNAETRIPDVICKFKMDTSYNIKIEVKADGSEYSVTINLKCEDITVTVLSGTPLSCTHKVFYKTELPNGEYGDAEMNLPIGGTNNLERTTVRWGVPEVIKGVEP